MRLPQHPIRIGSQVVSRDDADSPTYEVLAIEDGLATVVLVRDADGAYVARGEHAVGERERLPLDSLVVITDFGEPVLPGFRSLGTVERGGDKPYHVVINGENHHVLEALRFTHAGKVDCIYIDPPYNSGASDWKYNNDYVDADRRVSPQQVARFHGASPEAREGSPQPRRLRAHRHYRRAGSPATRAAPGTDLPEGRIQMVTSVISAEGCRRRGQFSRVEEYLFFVLFGGAAYPCTTCFLAPMPRRSQSARSALAGTLRRRRLIESRSGHLDRTANQFFPIFVDPETGPDQVDRGSAARPTLIDRR